MVKFDWLKLFVTLHGFTFHIFPALLRCFLNDLAACSLRGNPNLQTSRLSIVTLLRHPVAPPRLATLLTGKFPDGLRGGDVCPQGCGSRSRQDNYDYGGSWNNAVRCTEYPGKKKFRAMGMVDPFWINDYNIRFASKAKSVFDPLNDGANRM